MFCKMVSWFGRIHPWLGDYSLDLFLGIVAAGNEFVQKLRTMLLLVGDCTQLALEILPFVYQRSGPVGSRCPPGILGSVELLAVVTMPGWMTWMTGPSMR